MNLLIFDVFRDFGDILVTSLILGAAMACYGLLWLVNGLLLACQWLVIGLPCAGVVLIVNWNMSPAVEYLGLQWLVIGLPCAGVVLIV